jgi:hypothetical protein
MNETDSPRYRIVLEISFPDSNPYDDETCLSQLRSALGEISNPRLENIRVRDVLTISSGEDDYSEWKLGRGKYDPTKKPQETIGRVFRSPKEDQEDNRS